ncbi:MAG: hypothetical protein LBT40_08420 [Deltaproteobacteria bacterium]|jgi:hypothetical protein|nr:hypothetical protein [Deltaproteobacteria bacterium]
METERGAVQGYGIRTRIRNPAPPQRHLFQRKLDLASEGGMIPQAEEGMITQAEEGMIPQAEEGMIPQKKGGLKKNGPTPDSAIFGSKW